MYVHTNTYCVVNESRSLPKCDLPMQRYVEKKTQRTSKCIKFNTTQRFIHFFGTHVLTRNNIGEMTIMFFMNNMMPTSASSCLLHFTVIIHTYAL